MPMPLTDYSKGIPMETGEAEPQEKTITVQTTNKDGSRGVVKTLKVASPGSVLHVVCGLTDIWDPTDKELEDICQLFVTALDDPKGGVVVTRDGVETTVIAFPTDPK